MFLPQKNNAFGLPKIHALTGCDTKSYFYQVKKIKLLGQQSLYFLLSKLGNYSQITKSVIEDTKEFIKAALYNGNKKQSNVNTRVKIHKGLKQKSSLTLSPDPDLERQNNNKGYVFE